MCPKCEMAYGEPKMHPECNDPECGKELSETSKEPIPDFTIDVDHDSDINGECHYSGCSGVSTHVWFGIDEMNKPFIGEYCPLHSQNHAEIEPDMSYLGKLSKEDGSRYGVTD